MTQPMSDERLAEILWEARKRTLGYDAATFPLGEMPANQREQYRRFAAEVAAQLDQDRDAELERLRAELATARRDRDGYLDECNGNAEFFGYVLELLPGATDEGMDACDQIPRAIRKLTAERERVVDALSDVGRTAEAANGDLEDGVNAELLALRAEVEQWRATFGETALRDGLARLARVEAERGRLAEQVKRARELHQPVCGGACGLDDACECEDRDLICAEDNDRCPCPTIRALDGTESGR